MWSKRLWGGKGELDKNNGGVEKRSVHRTCDSAGNERSIETNALLYEDCPESESGRDRGRKTGVIFVWEEKKKRV